MDTTLLEIHEIVGPGYKPLADYGTWRVAMLRFIDDLTPSLIEYSQRHNETDEVFVLLAGQGVLFIGEGDAQVEKLTPLVMEPLKLYNVKQGVWHNIVLSHDASVLLVENRDTGTANSDDVLLSAEQRKLIVETAARELPAWWGGALASSGPIT